MSGSLAAQPEVAAQLKLFSAWAEAQMAYAGQPGLSVAVVSDQELVWAGGFGFANLERRVPATAGTLYRIASITKVFTATALLLLRDEGRVQLDDPVAKHLSWFKLREEIAGAPSVTLRHLLTHTGGLPREAGFPYWSDLKFPSREELRADLPGRPAILAPETRWKYSNLALALAGEAVAAVAGESFASFVRRRILEPLEMSSTLVESPAPDHPGLALGYGRRLPDGSRDVAPFADTQGLAPAANMTTSVEDLARFAMLQFRDGPAGGRQILRGSTLREMQRVHWLDPDWKAGWGLGFRVTRAGGKTWAGHGGALCGYRTHLHFCPEEKVGFIAFTNADDGNAGRYTDKTAEWLAPALRKAAAPKTPPAAPDPAWRRYEGRYRNRWGDTQVLLLDGTLVVLDPSLPDPLPSAVKLTPLSGQAFRMDAPEGFQSHGELCVFELDGAGRVTRLKQGETYSDRVEAW